MTNYDYKYRLNELMLQAGMHLRYHRCLADKWVRWDRRIRATVLVLTIIGMVLSVPGIGWPGTGLGVAITSLAAAGILNFLPIGDWAREDRERFRAWSDLRKDANREQLTTSEKHDEKEARPYRLECLADRAAGLDAALPAPDKKLLQQCEGDEYAAMYGADVRSAAQAKERAARELAGLQVTSTVLPAAEVVDG